MKNSIKIVILFIGLLMITLSCRSEDAEQGPQGEPGTANVIYSPWFTADNFTEATVYGIKNMYYVKSAPQITQEILDTGVVLVYGNLSGYVSTVWPAGQVSQLPISLTYVQGGQTMTDTWSAVQTVGKLTMKFINDKNYYTASGLSTVHKFRYVIIPGGVAGKQNLDYSKMSYKELCAKFNIQP